MIRAKKATRPSTLEEWPHTTPPSALTSESGRAGEALVFATPGHRYRIEDIRFEIAKETCAELGCTEGSEVVCVENDVAGVSVFLTDGRRKFLGREYAWFVKIREIGRAPTSVSPSSAGLRPLSRIA